jgi:UDP-sulfoquinovose synthase
VIHYAEQPSAPYSLINYKYANITIANNLLVTNNLMFALQGFQPENPRRAHRDHGRIRHPQHRYRGRLDRDRTQGPQGQIPFSRGKPARLYHTTKIMDTDLMWFSVRMWNLRVTDLMQGPVYGIETDESA